MELCVSGVLRRTAKARKLENKLKQTCNG